MGSFEEPDRADKFIDDILMPGAWRRPTLPLR
jgi:hypothetical protein